MSFTHFNDYKRVRTTALTIYIECVTHMDELKIEGQMNDEYKTY
jgi:hypothetical protein